MFRKRTPPAGSMPGTFMVDSASPRPRIYLFAYSPETLVEKLIEDPDELAEHLDSDLILWVDVQGLGDEAVLRRIGELFEIHPLALADVVNIPQRPKVDPYEHNLFIVSRMAKFDEDDHLDIEQVSLVLGRRYVVTFQERPGDVFDPLRVRLRNSAGPSRRNGADFLAYALLDAIIDGYYPILEELGELISELEDEAVESVSNSTLRRINRLRRATMHLLRSVWPQREAVNSLIRDPNSLMCGEVRVYLRDCMDHIVQVAEVLESYREVVSALASTYLSAVSNRTNEVMKVLTVMSTIFIPLTFLVGVYGMNFEYMPELHKRLAYPALWGVMILVAAAMILYFRHLGWFGGDDEEEED